MNPGVPWPQVLVLAPVRELVQQMDSVIRLCASSVGLETFWIIGGDATSRTQMQMCRMKQPPIIIDNPGRLLDLVNKGVIDLAAVTFAFIDEADDMLNQGFVVQYRPLLSGCQPGRQTLMWSATWPKAVGDLAREFLNADHIQVVQGASERTVNRNIERIIIRAEGKYANFADLVQETKNILIDSENNAKMIIVANSPSKVQELSEELEMER
jgi:superfamily II DNA/RNA helicase